MSFYIHIINFKVELRPQDLRVQVLEVVHELTENINLAEAIAKSGTSIDKKFIKVVGGSVKRLGKYEAAVRLHREVVADITFEVVAEK